jgi:hypothetical protein
MEIKKKCYKVKGEAVELFDYEIQALLFLHYQKMLFLEQLHEHLIGYHKVHLDTKSYEKRLTYLWHSNLIEVGPIGKRYFVILSEDGERFLRQVTKKAKMNYSAPLVSLEKINNHLHVQQIIVGYFNLVGESSTHPIYVGTEIVSDARLKSRHRLI